MAQLQRLYEHERFQIQQRPRCGTCREVGKGFFDEDLFAFLGKATTGTDPILGRLSAKSR